MVKNTFDELEFNKLKEKYNKNAFLKEYKVELDNSYFMHMAHIVETDRRGEVSFAVVTKDNKIIMVTCDEYKEGTYRIPTGGIEYGEDIEEAIVREVKEELGLVAKISTFIGAIDITFYNLNEEVHFYSYLFLLNEESGNLLKDATDDEISEVELVNVNQMLPYINILKEGQNDYWKAWGEFRYISTYETYKYLLDNR